MASPVDTSVKYFLSSMTGAPTVAGTAGSLISMLDAVLVNGFGTKAVDSAAVTGGICRMNFASGKSAAEFHSVISVTGFTNAALNGEQRVTAVGTNFVEFATAVADGAAAGSISFKLAPLGWEKVFSGTNKAVYRQTDPASTRSYYRVDDSNALYARVQMYESMTDVDTGTAAAPTTVAGGFYWHKRTTAAATAVFWILVGDSRGFYPVIYPTTVASAASPGAQAGTSAYAGDLNSYRSGDAWCGALTGRTNTTTAGVEGCVFSSSLSSGATIKRLVHGMGAAVLSSRTVLGGSNSISGSDNTLGVFPSSVDNTLRLSPFIMPDGTAAGTPARGEMPGAYYAPHSGVRDVIGIEPTLLKGQGPFIGKYLLTFHVGASNSTAQGIGFIDLTGPWRA